MIISFSEETKQLLTIKGNWLQALGGGIALGDDLGHTVSPYETLSIIKNILQMIGSWDTSNRPRIISNWSLRVNLRRK